MNTLHDFQRQLAEAEKRRSELDNEFDSLSKQLRDKQLEQGMAVLSKENAEQIEREISAIQNSIAGVRTAKTINAKNITSLNDRILQEKESMRLAKMEEIQIENSDELKSIYLKFDQIAESLVRLKNNHKTYRIKETDPQVIKDHFRRLSYFIGRMKEAPNVFDGFAGELPDLRDLKKKFKS